MSSGSPSRLVGIAGGERVAEVLDEQAAKSVLTRPGAMPTTRVGPSSPASWRVRWISAAFVTL